MVCFVLAGACLAELCLAELSLAEICLAGPGDGQQEHQAGSKNSAGFHDRLFPRLKSTPTTTAAMMPNASANPSTRSTISQSNPVSENRPGA